MSFTRTEMTGAYVVRTMHMCKECDAFVSWTISNVVNISLSDGGSIPLTQLMARYTKLFGPGKELKYMPKFPVGLAEVRIADTVCPMCVPLFTAGNETPAHRFLPVDIQVRGEIEGGNFAPPDGTDADRKKRKKRKSRTIKAIDEDAKRKRRQLNQVQSGGLDSLLKFGG